MSFDFRASQLPSFRSYTTSGVYVAGEVAQFFVRIANPETTALEDPTEVKVTEEQYLPSKSSGEEMPNPNSLDEDMTKIETGLYSYLWDTDGKTPGLWQLRFSFEKGGRKGVAISHAVVRDPASLAP